MKVSIALGLACTWLLALWAGADHPPPPRFVSVLPVVLVAALLVYWRAARYARWRSQRRPWHVVRVIGEGALAGVALGGILAALPGPKEPGVPITGAAVLLWLAVMGAVGIVNALLVYLLAGGLSRTGRGRRVAGPSRPSGTRNDAPGRAASRPPPAPDDPGGARLPGSRERPGYPLGNIDRRT
jgi:hypothetical protein